MGRKYKTYWLIVGIHTAFFGACLLLWIATQGGLWSALAMLYVCGALITIAWNTELQTVRDHVLIMLGMIACPLLYAIPIWILLPQEFHSLVIWFYVRITFKVVITVPLAFGINWLYLKHSVTARRTTT